MNRTTWLQGRRMKKSEDVLERLETKRLSASDAAGLPGMSERRVPVDRVAWVLETCRPRHTGWTVKHFHGHLQARHAPSLALHQDRPATA